MAIFRLSAFADEYSSNFDEQIKGLLENDLHSIEPRNIDGVNISDITSEKAMDIRAKLDAADITISAIGSPIGKIAIDDAVLRKPGKYTDEEYAEMKRHSAEGARIVENILQDVEDESFVQVAKNVAFYHHEKWNGQGYPLGKKGEEIPVEARIMALADVFDALVSKRCYKEAFSYDEAFRIMEESMGQQFDPELGQIFMNCRPELEAFYDANK